MGGVDKTFAPILGLPLIAHTLDQIEAFPPTVEIALVLAAASAEQGRELVRSRGYHKVVQVVTGGDRRQDSVRNGLESLSPCEWAMVHDGARPCLNQAIMERGMEAATAWGAAVAGVPVKDTIKRVSDELLVSETPDRSHLWTAQTPQVFRYSLLREAHRDISRTVTDDASMVERLGRTVQMFKGSYENIKVTTVEDLKLAEMFLRARMPGAG